MLLWKEFFLLPNRTDKAYVSFHDEQWGVPVYDDKYVTAIPSPFIN